MKPILNFKKYLEHKGISYKDADETLGLSKGYTSKQIRSEANIGSDILNKIFTNYFDLNPIWLLTNNGDMLFSDSVAVDNMVKQSKQKINDNNQEIISLLESKIEILQRRIKELEEENKKFLKIIKSR